MKKQIKFLSGIFAGIVISALFFTATDGFSAVPKVRSIKPAPQTAPLSDEQQGILAVRSEKAAVVSISGTGNLSPSNATLNTVAGSGFIVESDGLIVTNNHVVQDQNLTYTVTLLDGHQFPARVLGLDKYNDLAILKIEAKGLATARLGNSDSLETGQTVFAIGNALGRYQNSVTKGVVSGLGRAVDEGTFSGQPRLQNLIQTDAAINPGNSGGPLINMAGEVVGVNTLIDIGGSSLGFAVPVNVVKDSINQLKAFGKVSKAYLGITFATVTNAIRQLNNLTVDNGAYISGVVPDSPAARAGLLPGDVVTKINDTLLTQTTELDAVVNKLQAGTQILVTYLRNGQEIQAALVLGEFK